MKRDEEIVIIAGLSIALIIVVWLNFLDPEEMFLQFMVGEFEDFFGMISGDDFVRNAVLIYFAWELIPQTFQLLGLGAITTRLLMTGINPFILGLVTASGRLGGQIILYFAGKFIAKFIFKNTRREASAMHFMHKYHYLVFLFPAFLGALGDLIMLTAGHQKINLFKIMPILFIGNLADAYKWIFWGLGTIEATEALQ